MTDPEPNATRTDAEPASPEECTTSRIPNPWIDPFFWWAAYSGTVAAGGVFGLLVCLGGEFILVLMGPVLGVISAGVVAIPVHLTAAIMTWMVWASRFRLISAGIAGGTTGVLATRFVSIRPASWQLTWQLFWPGMIGAMGALAAGAWANRECRKATKTASADRVWQFTLCSLFWRMTVFAVLMAAWTSAIRTMH